MNDLGKSLLPFDRAVTQILITKAYDNMLHRLLAFRMQNQSHLRGAVVTGQPGVGASFPPGDSATTHRLFIRKIYFHKVHARAADFSSSSCASVSTR